MKHIGLVLSLMFVFSLATLQAQNCQPTPGCKKVCNKVAKVDKSDKASKSKGVLTLFSKPLVKEEKKNSCAPTSCNKSVKGAKAVKSSNVKMVSNKTEGNKKSCVKTCNKSKTSTKVSSKSKKALVAKND